MVFKKKKGKAAEADKPEEVSSRKAPAEPAKAAAEEKGNKEKGKAKRKDAEQAEASPKVAPKSIASPKVAPKDKKDNKAPDRTPPSEAEVKAATKKAIEMIKTGLQENPNSQDNGHPFIPREWASQCKPVLGGYRKFVEKCGVFMVKQGDNPAKFTVHLSDGTGPPPKPHWETALVSAWHKYLHDTPKEERQPTVFLAKAKEVTATTRPNEKEPRGKDAAGAGKAKAEQAAVAAPAPEAAAAPGTPKGKKRKKAEEEEGTGENGAVKGKKKKRAA